MLPSRVCLKAIDLNFASIHILSANVAEVFANEEVIVDEACVAEYHSALTAFFSSSFGILVNRMHSYSYSEYAKSNIAEIPNLKAVALLDVPGIQASNSTVELPKVKNKHFHYFCDREKALHWLDSMLSD